MKYTGTKLAVEFKLTRDGRIRKANMFTNMKAVANKIFSDTNIAEDGLCVIGILTPPSFPGGAVFEFANGNLRS